MTVGSQIIVILGPTASGKSALAMAVAEALRGEIVSVDSMQVYRDMDIGTAKPTIEEQQRVRHHLIDVVDPNQTFTVKQYVEWADAAIAEATARRVPLIVTGGTPMYYKALFEGIFEGPTIEEAVRLRLGQIDLGELYERLRQVDPEAAQRIHANDRRRIVRALEVFEATGKPITYHQREWGREHHRHEAIWFGLNWEKETLNRRVNARTKQMIQAGWLDETRRLLTKYGELSKTAGEATGYRELTDHILGRMSLDDASERIKIATRQLARRQVKWFRRFERVQWLDGSADPSTLLDSILEKVKA